MNKLYNILKITLYCLIGLFIVSSIYKYIDYKLNPDLYAVQSAPWYLGIQTQGILTVIILILILVAMKIVKNKIK